MSDDFDKNIRTSFKKSFKRKVLFECSCGKNPEQALFSCDENLQKIAKNDKKYASKLLHKWRNEVYKNNSIIYFLGEKLNRNKLSEELEYMYFDDEQDFIMDSFKRKVETNLEKYKSLKEYLRTKYSRR